MNFFIKKNSSTFGEIGVAVVVLEGGYFLAGHLMYCVTVSVYFYMHVVADTLKTE